MESRLDRFERGVRQAHLDLLEVGSPANMVAQAEEQLRSAKPEELAYLFGYKAQAMEYLKREEESADQDAVDFVPL